MSYTTPEPAYPEQPPPEPRRRPAWLLWLLLVLIVVGVILFGVTQCGTDTYTAPVGTTTPTYPPPGITTTPPEPPEPPVTTTPPPPQPPITTTTPAGGGGRTVTAAPPNRVDAGSGGQAGIGGPAGPDVALVVTGLLAATAAGLVLIGLRRRSG